MKKLFLLIPLFTLFLFIAPARSTHAQSNTIQVNTTAQSPGDSGDCTLGEAIQAANTDTAVDGCAAGSGADTILVPAGNYFLTTPAPTPNPQDRYGLPIVYDTVSIIGAGSNTTHIERSSQDRFQILFMAVPSNPPSYLKGMTLANGVGGQATVVTGALTLDDVVIRESSTNGIYVSGDRFSLGRLSINNSYIIGNTESGVAGNLGSISIGNSVIENNAGNGITAYESYLQIDHSTISANGRVGVWSLRETTYYTNLNIITNSVIADNGRQGILAQSYGHPFAVTNTTITGNRGGIRLKETLPFEIKNSTITGNTAKRGGGILRKPGKTPISIENSILSGNTASKGPNCSRALASGGHNLFGSLRDCAVTLRRTDHLTDPQLGAFQDNGEPGNGHFPLLPTSPAIDKIRTAQCPPTDQIGTPRTPRCDIGAIEYIPAP